MYGPIDINFDNNCKYMEKMTYDIVFNLKNDLSEADKHTYLLFKELCLSPFNESTSFLCNSRISVSSCSIFSCILACSCMILCVSLSLELVFFAS